MINWADRMSIATLLGVFFYPMLFLLIGKIAGYEKKRDAAMLQTANSGEGEE